MEVYTQVEIKCITEYVACVHIVKKNVLHTLLKLLMDNGFTITDAVRLGDNYMIDAVRFEASVRFDVVKCSDNIYELRLIVEGATADNNMFIGSRLWKQVTDELVERYEKCEEVCDEKRVIRPRDEDDLD